LILLAATVTGSFKVSKDVFARDGTEWGLHGKGERKKEG